MQVKVSETMRAFWVLVVASCVVGCTSTVPHQISTSTGTTQTAQINSSGPLLAAWWDGQAQGLRALYGVPGAAVESAPMDVNEGYAGAASCVRQNFVLLTSAAGNLDAVSLPQDEPMTIAHGVASTASISFSPSCSAALVYTPAKTQALLIQGLPANAETSNVALPVGTTAAIVADSGTILTANLAIDGSTIIGVLPLNGANQPVTTLSRLGSMAFQPGVDSAALADAGANTVIEASHVSGSTSLTPVAASKDGVAKPVAVATSIDGRWIAVANGQDGSILRLDLTGQTAPSRTLCQCTPTKLDPLAGSFAFRLNDPGTGTVWAFDGSTASSRVVFLPSAQQLTSPQGASR